MAHQNDAQTGTTQEYELRSALTNQYCRFVLRYFGNTSENTASVEDLSTAFTREHGENENPITLHLHHTALPKLSDVGVLDYDTQDKMVCYHGHPRLEDLLRIEGSESELAIEG